MMSAYALSEIDQRWDWETEFWAASAQALTPSLTHLATAALFAE